MNEKYKTEVLKSFLNLGQKGRSELRESVLKSIDPATKGVFDGVVKGLMDNPLKKTENEVAEHVLNGYILTIAVFIKIGIARDYNRNFDPFEKAPKFASPSFSTPTNRNQIKKAMAWTFFVISTNPSDMEEITPAFADGRLENKLKEFIRKFWPEEEVRTFYEDNQYTGSERALFRMFAIQGLSLAFAEFSMSGQPQIEQFNFKDSEDLYKHFGLDKIFGF